MLHNVFNVRYKSPSNSLECFFYDSVNQETISCVLIPSTNTHDCYKWRNDVVVPLIHTHVYYAHIIEKTNKISLSEKYEIISHDDISNTTYNHFCCEKVKQNILSKILHSLNNL